ncbi:MAG: glycerol-3-phosphate 1-O-acyltransferase PlsY [Pseudomonadota bacterium]|nr:glycerol-3-phosphate 1-O-acyltransferase PlsY [Pseudomonadota bacterium]
MLLELALIVFSYLLGSISSAIVVCWAGGFPDPRAQGSGNPGATNVLRLAGKPAAVITLAGDLFKGLLPLVIGRVLGVSDLGLALMGLATFSGHLYPLFFGFHGGKGVATFIGVLYGLAWPVGIGFMLVWLALAGLFRYSSLAALGAAACAPFMVFLLDGTWIHVAVVVLMVALIFWRHRGNLRKLLAGTESKIGAEKSAARAE